MARQTSRILLAFGLLSCLATAFASAEGMHGYWVGTIGDLPVQMDLDLSAKQPTGSYFYERSGIPLELSGTIESDGTIRLIEKTPKGHTSGYFHGSAPDEGGKFAGIWTAADGSTSLPFRLHQAAAFGTLAAPPLPGIKATFRYPVLAGQDDATMQVNAEIERFAREARDAFFKERRQESDGKSHEPAWECEVNCGIHYIGPTVVSLLASDYEFTGGAHGSLGFRAFNFELKQGKAVALELKDLFVAKAQYLPTLSRLCIAQLKDKEAAWVMNGQVKGFTEHQLSTFLIGPDGITFVFAPYNVGPWAQGAIQATIPFDDLKGLIAPEGPCGRWIPRAIAKAKPSEPLPAEAHPASATIKAATAPRPPKLSHPLSEGDAVKLVAELPEVQAFFAAVRSSPEGHGRAIAMGQGHGSDPNAWEVYVGEDDAVRKTCWNRFRVEQKTGAILVWNAPSYNTLLPLDTWREKRQESARATDE